MRALLHASIVLSTSSIVRAHSNFANLIPNGHNVVGASNTPWPAVGHVGPRPLTAAQDIHIGGGFPRNPFGLDFAHGGFKWTPELCAKDSDGDGVTNGHELGDPECLWEPGRTPAREQNITHPGYSAEQLAYIYYQAMQKEVMNKLSGGTAGEQFVNSDTISIGRPFNSDASFLLPYVWLPTGIALGLAIKWYLGPKLPAVRWLLIWCTAEYLGIFGIGVAQHRYFTHQAFKANWLGKQVLGISGALTLQGPPQHWAFMHRIHHRLCDQELDFHSPIASNRGLWFSHATWMTTPHPHYREKGRMLEIIKDLTEDPDIQFMYKIDPAYVVVGMFSIFAVVTTIVTLINVWRDHRRMGGATFLSATLCPALRRLPASIWFYYSMYYWLPVLGSWHGTMLINSATHWWGEMPHEDAMSAACQARNVPALQWVLMGENWHNNHHAAPTSASTWVEWYQVDGVYILIRCLELVGLAHDVKTEIPLKREGFVETGWEFPIQITTQLFFFWLWWHFYLSRDYCCAPVNGTEPTDVEMLAAKDPDVKGAVAYKVDACEVEPLAESSRP